MEDPSGEYRRQINAWVTYDWANSAFVTTVLAAVFPVYYASVAGSTLASPATATQLYTLTLSASVLVVAFLSPVLGAAADASGTRKRLLAGFMLLGVVATAAMFGIGEGDWLLASLLFAIGRIGLGGSNVMYDALLPHVARPEDVDRVSARGYAFGYLGGGLLLAVNVAMIFALPDGDLGVRLSLLSVAVWWLVFSVPLLRRVPEPPATRVAGAPRSTVRAAMREAWTTLKGLRALPDLRRYLIAYLIYNDGINTVITVAAIYGAELGFGAVELTLAILLVQFVGIPYSLLFGALPGAEEARRRVLTAFIVANIVLLPLVGIALRTAGPADVVGRAQTPFPDEGIVEVLADGSDRAVVTWTGQSVTVTYRSGPDVPEVTLLLDGQPVTDEEDLRVVIGGDAPVDRTGQTEDIEVEEPGPHTLAFVGADDPGQVVEEVEVLPPPRTSDLAVILLVVLVLQLVAFGFAATIGKALLAPLADAMTTKRAITLSLSAYAVVAVWGFVLDSVAEFWFLAWLVAVVQGGSQALSRSLYTRLIPESRSGEYFGFFSILSKFASILSPLLFVVAVAAFDSSRPAVLALVVFFAGGIALLAGVDVDRGSTLAARLDAAARAGRDGAASAD